MPSHRAVQPGGAADKVRGRLGKSVDDSDVVPVGSRAHELAGHGVGARAMATAGVGDEKEEAHHQLRLTVSPATPPAVKAVTGTTLPPSTLSMSTWDTPCASRLRNANDRPDEATDTEASAAAGGAGLTGIAP